MGFWAFCGHVLNFFAPAFVMSLALTWLVVGVGVVWGRPARAHPWRVWGVLNMVGVILLLLGLWYFGHDGKMATYTTMVWVMGTLAYILRRHCTSAASP